MESSIGLAFRALVMLACLAVVPVLAMYGKFIPEMAQAAIDAYHAKTHSKPAENPGGEAPPFNPNQASAPSAGSTSGSSDMPSRWNDTNSAARPLADWRPQPAANSSGGLQQASFDSAAGKSPPGGLVGSANNFPSDGSHAAGNAPGANSPADLQSPSSGKANPPAAPSAGCEQFRGMEQRLRELGSTYYLLEAWGASGDRYRFICHMAIGGHARYSQTRVFQATSADPLEAMRDVLNQVEQWRPAASLDLRFARRGASSRQVLVRDLDSFTSFLATPARST